MHTADENYIAARWCCANALYTDFLWLALHATEKYLKAVLLMNGKSARRFGHDIEGLYAQVKELAGSLLPGCLPKPEKLAIPTWFDRTTEEFIAHLVRYGNADNRYLIYGYNTFSQDLHMLDELVWAVRRLVLPLNERIASDWPDGERLPKYKEVLVAQPDFRFALYGLPLDNLILAKEDTLLRLAALNLNFSFAPSDFRHASMRGGSASFNSVIFRHIFEPLGEGEADAVGEAAELADWLIRNVQLPTGRNGSPDVVGEIEKAVASAKQRHGLS
ncbi:HEPN domain-containing protein [Teichococcus vastitatis]|uniref:HEPN domain-containing protein n=1 Tax=Teichococcus vastitatis TaxID=2307076 RepID=UPI0013006F07|nr:HEPN domain-containing protein [Pseudoroseomonas vastitatis]